jgi:hypothetical protein
MAPAATPLIGDGLFTLLGGSEGLQVEATLSNPALTQPSAVVLAGVNQDAVDFYATTAGVEAAYALEFILPGRSASIGPISGEAVTEGSTPLASSPVTSSGPIPGGAQLLPLSETTLPLVGTLLTVGLDTRSSTTPTSLSASSGQGVSTPLTPTGLTIALLPETGPSSGQGPGLSNAVSEAAAAVSSPAAPTSSAGQSLLNPANTPEERSAGDEEGKRKEMPFVDGSKQTPTPWTGFLPSRDEVLDEIREDNQRVRSGSDGPESTGGSGADWLVEPLGPESWDSVAPRDRAALHAIDEAIRSLWPAPQGQSTESVSVSTPLVLSAMLIVHSTRLTEAPDTGRRRERIESLADHHRDSI